MNHWPRHGDGIGSIVRRVDGAQHGNLWPGRRVLLLQGSFLGQAAVVRTVRLSGDAHVVQALATGAVRNRGALGKQRLQRGLLAAAVAGTEALAGEGDELAALHTGGLGKGFALVHHQQLHLVVCVVAVAPLPPRPPRRGWHEESGSEASALVPRLSQRCWRQEAWW